MRTGARRASCAGRNPRLAGLSAATVIPTRYLYPTRGGPFARLLEITGVAWVAVVVLVISRPLGERRGVTIASLAYPIAYLGLSWLVEKRERITAQAEMGTRDLGTKGLGD